MILKDARSQQAQYDLLDFSGVIAAGGTAQMLVPAQKSRSYLLIQNNSIEVLTVGIGPATATAVLAAGGITAVAVNNVGIGYTVAPQVMFLGGIVSGDFTTDLAKELSPSFKPAQAFATLGGGGGIASVTVTDPGQGYLVAPYVYFHNPWTVGNMPINGAGAFLPSATVGIALAGATAPAAGGSIVFENTVVPTSAVAIFGATNGSAFSCKVGI